MLLVLGFGSSERLAGAYGVAVCGYLPRTTYCFGGVQKSLPKVLGDYGGCRSSADSYGHTQFTANVDKIGMAA